jgi:hypothetical protein
MTVPRIPEIISPQDPQAHAYLLGPNSDEVKNFHAAGNDY